MAVAGVSISRSAFSSFDISNKRAFIMDIIWDVLFLCAAVGISVFVWAMNLFYGNVPWESFAFAASASAVSMIDFLVSLNGGAGKLLEMNREHYARDRE